MPSCDKASLTLAAACFTCLSEKELRAVRILLKCNQLNGISMNCNPNSLCTAATLAGYMNMSVKQQMAVETYLDCQIANGGASGSANYYGSYGGNSANIPTPSSGNPFAFDSVTNSEWIWSGTNWVTIIA